MSTKADECMFKVWGLLWYGHARSIFCHTALSLKDDMVSTNAAWPWQNTENEGVISASGSCFRFTKEQRFVSFENYLMGLILFLSYSYFCQKTWKLVFFFFFFSCVWIFRRDYQLLYWMLSDSVIMKKGICLIFANEVVQAW